MKVCLIYPNLDGTPQSLDMGVAYLATYIDERTSHKVRIVDLTFHRRHWESYIKEELEKLRPDAVGISVVSLFFDHAKKIAKKIKEHANIPIIVGGYQAIMAPEETMKVEEFDAMCTGDGEYTLEEYLKALECKGDLREVKGIWFRENGKIVKNEKREYNADLDSLPIPNYDLFDDIDKYLYYLQRLYVIGTRGCPYACTFCAESVLNRLNPGKRFRERDPRRYVREIEYLYNKYKNRGIKIAHLYDAVFSFNDKWLNEWADEYKKRGLHKVLPYSTFLKADRRNASDEKIKLLAETGCLQVRIGIESGDDNLRENVINKKGSSDNVAMDVIDECNRYGLIVKTYNILGIPGDTKESMRKTFNYSRTPLIHTPLYFSYTPLPNTPLAECVRAMNESSSAQKVYSFHYSRGARNEGVSPYYVPQLILKSYLYFGSRLVWNVFMANPIIFFPRLLSRICRGFIWDCPLLSTSGYALIDPTFWPNLSKRIKKKWELRRQR
jgi:radical SAM superfamily enzyme YgiQ (UPF0313 family)